MRIQFLCYFIYLFTIYLYSSFLIYLYLVEKSQFRKWKIQINNYIEESSTGEYLNQIKNIKKQMEVKTTDMNENERQ